MKTYKVTVLNVGTLKVDKSILTRGVGCGEVLEVPVRSLAVEGDGVKMIVDTGISPSLKTYDKIPGLEIVDSKDTMESALAAIGWKKEDVNYVVNTNLHFMCCGGNALFENAKLLVQKKEWAYAHKPSLNQVNFYRAEDLANSAGCGVNMELADGECEIAEGLILLPTPGYTRGHQSLLVNLEEGVLCFAGHAVNLMENLKEDVIGNVLDDTGSAFDSMEWIRRTSKYIIPAYDTAVAPFAKDQFPEVH